MKKYIVRNGAVYALDGYLEADQSYLTKRLEALRTLPWGVENL